MIFQREETCEGCLRKIEVYQIQIQGGPDKGTWIDWKRGCICEDLELAERAIKHKNQLMKRKMQDIFKQKSLISRDLERASFESFVPENNSQQFAKRTAERYVEVFDVYEPRNLSFHGSFGIGKSHLAKAIADGVMDKGFSSVFISVPKLLRKIKATYNKEAQVTEDEIISTLEDVDLLILDDLGAEKSTDWASERLFDIIDSRQGKHTIYTTNFSPNDLIEALGERNFSRVINRDTTIVEIEGENNRLKDLKGASN